ncbi:response regulator [Aquimarina sp. U1-2]|uniref:response regulator n=1 Tax=Aquimarina sp. U1-2 TaxID=2823141 RepID=UPI001AECD9E4|nr:response regulator [Aquimarina sp. U1-2]MBP2831967.1 response regulator [Aquimarina sp. U1-2]
MIYTERAHHFLSDYKTKESLVLAHKVLHFSYQIDNDQYKAIGHHLVARNYEYIRDYKNIEFHYGESLKYSRIINDSIRLLHNLSGLGNLQINAYGDIDKSLDYFQKSLLIAEKQKNNSIQLDPLINLSTIYLHKNAFNKSYSYLQQASKLAKKSNDTIAVNKVRYLLASYYVKNNELLKAHQLYDTIIGQTENQELYVLLKDAYKAKSDMFRRQNNIDSAYYHLVQYSKYDDKLLEKEKLVRRQLGSFNLNSYDDSSATATSEKEEEYLARIAKSTNIINIFSIGLVALLLGVVLMYRGYRSKKKLSKVLTLKNEQLSQAKTEAEKLTSIKSQFISTVSHELRTPLYGVVGITTLLLEDSEIKAKHKKLLNSLKFSGDYLLDLINKVLKISKIESNTEKLTKTPTNLSQLSQNLLYSFEYQAKNKNNELVLDVQDELPKVLSVDSLKLSEVLINLIGNAAKFTENGKIWLRIKILSIQKDEVTIRYEVEDNGIGIPEDKKEFVFEKFSQVGRESNTSEGTGLGLSIVKNLLEMMNSDIHLESKEGRGTKFYFDLTLEILDDSDKHALRPESNGLHQKFKRILVAEDNKINQIVTKNLLNLIGYECTIVENGFNALQMVQKEDFDLILMDLNMPYLNGTEATKRIREFDQTTPIIALTASELSEVQEECLEIGMNDIINKPLNKNDLKSIIAKNLIS